MVLPYVLITSNGVHGQECSTRPSCRKSNSKETASQFFDEVLNRDLDAVELRMALNRIITESHGCVPYRGCAEEALAELDESINDADSITGFYSRLDIKKSNRGTSDKTWSNEHIYPAGRWDRDKGKRKFVDGDLHNLVAEVGRVNIDRSDDDFDDVGSEGKTPQNCTDCKEIEGEAWEPPNDQKGQVARILFYMDVRYSDPDGQDTKQETNLNLVKGRSDKDIKGTSSQLGNLDTLLKWHCENPVTKEERVRNDQIHQVWQGNRNPFVDYPDFVEIIFGHTCPPGSANSAAILNADDSSKVDRDGNTVVTVDPSCAERLGVCIVSANVNPRGTDRGREEVTLENFGSDAIDITNWSIVDKNGLASMIGSASIAAKSSITIVLESGARLVNSDTGRIRLVNESDEIVDEVLYIEDNIDLDTDGNGVVTKFQREEL